MPTPLPKPMPAEGSPYSRHVLSLDGLRGLAVLVVMASHLFSGTARGLLFRVVGSALTFGAVGVDLFFVLSGFLITGILYDSLSDTGYFRKFYARRALRIFPLYYGVLFILLLLTPVLGLQWHGMQWSLLAYLQNTNIVMPLYLFHLGHGIMVDHFWSLAVEEQFYFVWPLAVFLLRDRKKLLPACFLLSVASLILRFVLAFQHTRYDVINRSTLCRADALLIGAALALLLRGRMHDRTLASARNIFFVAGALSLLYPLRSLFDGQPGWSFPIDASLLALRYTFQAVASAALLAWCLQPQSGPRRFFESTGLRFFGRYSYGLYVLHFIALGFILQRARGWIGHFTQSKLISIVGAGLIAFVIAVIAAWLSFNLYEKHFLRLKRFFDYDRSRRQTPQVVALGS